MIFYRALEKRKRCSKVDICRKWVKRLTFSFGMWNSDFLLVLWIWKHEFLVIVNAPYFTTGYNFKLLFFCISAIVLFGSIRGSIWTIIYVIAASSSISVVAKNKLRIESMNTSVADLTIFNSEMLYRVMRVSPIFFERYRFIPDF